MKSLIENYLNGNLTTARKQARRFSYARIALAQNGRRLASQLRRYLIPLLMNAKYQIRYQHTSWDCASSKQIALRRVRLEGQVSRLFTVDCSDGLYCYLSREDKDRDQTGARAFAVICSQSQN